MNEDSDHRPAPSSSTRSQNRTEKLSTVPANGPFSWFGVVAFVFIFWMKRIIAFLYRGSARTWRSYSTKSSINSNLSDSKFARVFILDDVSSCDEKLLGYLSRYEFRLNFVGLDCEWVSRKGCSNVPVALLQIATPENECFLVRLCKMDGILPVSVKKILEDRSILKFGVGIQGDAKKLSSTYGVLVSGCVDLRHVVLRCRAPGQPADANNEKMSLDALAEQILGVKMDKHWTTRCSNWEAEVLTQRQADYAMNDALVAVHIFLKLVESKGKERQTKRLVGMYSPVDKDSTRHLVSHMYDGQGQSVVSDQTGGEDGGFVQEHAPTGMNSNPVVAKQVDSNNQEDTKSSEAEGVHSTVDDTLKSFFVGANVENNPKCRRRTFQQLKGLTDLDHKSPGIPNEMDNTRNKSVGYEGVEDDSDESYYKRCVTLEKWEANPCKGYVRNMRDLLKDPLFCQKAVSLCHGITDMDLKVQKKKRKKKTVDGEVDGTSDKVKPKPYNKGTTRKTPLYSKCILVAPDGAKLCTLDRKKADWYIIKEIGELISLEPYTVRLKFEPSGRPQAEDSYYLSFKENVCVVCGRDETYLRKSIVPHDYRRHFPLCMKDHHCHDILLMCAECHRVSNFYDEHLRQKLAREYGAPLGTAAFARHTEDPELKKVKSAARALVSSGGKIPENRCNELRGIIQAFYDTTCLSEEMIHDAANLNTHKENCNYISHGEEVVKKVQAEGKLLEFERMWRQNFLDNMSPQFLPPMWCVDHHHQKLKGILECLDS